MRKYELMLITDPANDPTDNKKRDQIIAKLLGTDIGFIRETTTIGKKKLAYEINKFKEGIYCLIKLEADKLNMSQMRKQAKMMPEIIRFMLVAV
jgi:small subunit ribosomal protein S6